MPGSDKAEAREPEVLYSATGLEKRYPGVQALKGVDMDVRTGEVHALVGANGAGKSTLVKILVGAEVPSAGSLQLAGDPVRFTDVSDAAKGGVAFVSQELNLFPHLSILHNLFVRREPLRARVFEDRAQMRHKGRAVLEEVGLELPLDRQVGTLRLGERQLVEIARALLDEPRVLILDEPTSALSAPETARLLEIVKGLRDRGVAVVYVSHILEDVFAVADRITILRDGRTVVARARLDGTSIGQVVREMLGQAAASKGNSNGRRVENREVEHVGRQPLELSGVAVRGLLDPVDLVVRPGEVVGLAGLDGSGVQILLEILFGRRRADAGSVTLPSGAGAPRSTTAAVRSGVAFVPADRKKVGLMLAQTAPENIACVNAGPLRGLGWVIRRRDLVKRADHWASRLKIERASESAPVGQLSGGNQQKVVFAKWLETDPSLVLLDDPTRGVDVGARAEMHGIIGEMASSGRVILVTSGELEELCKLCDRVIVFFQGRVRGEIRPPALNGHALLEAINTGICPEADPSPVVQSGPRNGVEAANAEEEVPKDGR